jgi:hypothetical protein
MQQETCGRLRKTDEERVKHTYSTLEVVIVDMINTQSLYFTRKQMTATWHLAYQVSMDVQ